MRMRSRKLTFAPYRSQGGGWWVVGGGKIFPYHLPPTTHLLPPLFQNLRYSSCPYGPSAFANREPQSFVHGHRRDQFHHQAHVVAGHYHLAALGQLRHPRHVRRPEIKLGTVSLEKRCVPPAFFFAQYVDFALELLVRLDRSRLRYYLAALHVVLFNSAQQQELKRDRKSTRLNSSHQIISYAVFCLKKKKKHLTYVCAR